MSIIFGFEQVCFFVRNSGTRMSFWLGHNCKTIYNHSSFDYILIPQIVLSRHHTTPPPHTTLSGSLSSRLHANIQSKRASIMSFVQAEAAVASTPATPQVDTLSSSTPAPELRQPNIKDALNYLDAVKLQFRSSRLFIALPENDARFQATTCAWILLCSSHSLCSNSLLHFLRIDTPASWNALPSSLKNHPNDSRIQRFFGRYYIDESEDTVT